MDIKMRIGVLIILCLSQLASFQELYEIPPCDSMVYCDGPILEAVQMARFFPDSKTFVDMNLKVSEEEALRRFDELQDPTDEELMEFVEQNFNPVDSEFEDYIPEDWREEPLFLSKINDTNLRQWAVELNEIWKVLGRKISTDVKSSSDRYSLIYVDNPFVVPGGRFREFYYWDTYWIIKGLLLSEMDVTVKGMIQNWLTLVQLHGKVLNGNRIYYINRSQPPFLIPSVYEYLKATDDRAFVISILPQLEAEYMFWRNERQIIITLQGNINYSLSQYRVPMGMPRPESYYEDRETVESLNVTVEQGGFVYSDLAAGAESGWDYTSRWLGESNQLNTIRTSQIVPVDLNSLLCLNEKLLAGFYLMAGNIDKVREYLDYFEERRDAIQSVLWDEEAGVWLDYDLEKGTRNNRFFVSNIAPLWARCFNENENGAMSAIEESVLEYLKDQDVLSYPGGVPASLNETGQQWDFPNAWPPLQEMMIQALDMINDEEAKEMAYNLASNWTKTNWGGYKKSKFMYEKYDARSQGDPGFGGEYEVQGGFGWTNGVIMTLLDKYGDRLEVESEPEDDGSGCAQLYGSIICVLACLLTSKLVN